VDVLNCFPVKEEEVLLMEFEERLVLIERVAKTLLDAMIDCILYTCVCICVRARFEECSYDGGRAGSFQIQRV